MSWFLLCEQDEASATFLGILVVWDLTTSATYIRVLKVRWPRDQTKPAVRSAVKATIAQQIYIIGKC
jgi:hypothetical protein